MQTEKEMTTPNAPTEIGAEQSNPKDNNIIAQNQGYFNPSAEEIFEAQMQYERENSPSYMETVSMPELYEMIYPVKPPIIDGFLYNGTYLFVGSPKVGKSFMMAQIAYHVSSGKPMDIQNGIAQALKEMGYGDGKQAIACWRTAEVDVLNKICRRYGIEPLSPKKARGTLEVAEYKEQRRKAEQLADENEKSQYELDALKPCEKTDCECETNKEIKVRKC